MFFVHRLFTATGEYTVTRYGSLTADVRLLLTAEGIERVKQQFLAAERMNRPPADYVWPSCIEFTTRF